MDPFLSGADGVVRQLFYLPVCAFGAATPPLKGGDLRLQLSLYRVQHDFRIFPEKPILEAEDLHAEVL